MKRRTVKERHRGHFDQVHLNIASNHTSILMNNDHILCIYQDLHLHPHGDDDVKEKDKHEILLREANIPSTTVRVKDQYFNDGPIIVIRESHRILQSASVFYQGISGPLVDLIVKGDGFYKTNDPRVHGSNYRFFLGFSSRIQRRKKQKLYRKGTTTVSLPSIHKKGEHLLREMDPKLKAKFGMLLKECENLVCCYHPDAFRDIFRNDFWRNKWSSKHWPELNISWEFIDISMKDVIHDMKCHLDYMNDYRKGYNYCAVFSSVVDVNGTLNRLTIIMASRKICGRVIQRIKNSINSIEFN